MKDEVDSQLSAMFDGELPAAECELLSRRIDRDEKLRTRWARYVLIGASMRYEPVATASSGFAARIGAAVAALDGEKVAGKPAQRARLSPPNWVWQTALGAGLVVAVAGLSIEMLRNAALNSAGSTMTAGSTIAAPPSLSPPASVPAAFAATSAVPWSYVTPSTNERFGAPMPLRSQLTDYIVAHSEYSTPLMRPDLLSALVGGEQGLDAPSGAAGVNPSGTGEVDAPAAASPAH
jgi:sigma-E factor negative regulatory protein RseA